MAKKEGHTVRQNKWLRSINNSFTHSSRIIFSRQLTYVHPEIIYPKIVTDLILTQFSPSIISLFFLNATYLLSLILSPCFLAIVAHPSNFILILN
jgi:hypothetical protein